MEPEESAAVYLEYTGYPPMFVQSQRVGVPGNVVILILIVLSILFIMTSPLQWKKHTIFIFTFIQDPPHPL